MDRPPNLVIVIGERRVQCENGEDRNLLVAAKSIAEEPHLARNTPLTRLALIKEACQKYSLGKLQRLVKQAMEGARE